MTTCEKRNAAMGSIVIACYKPRPGQEEALLALVRDHLAPLRAENLPANLPEFQNMFSHFEAV